MAQQISERKCDYLESTLRDAMEAGEIAEQDPKLLAQELRFLYRRFDPGSEDL